jgi:hypothetical protein
VPELDLIKRPVELLCVDHIGTYVVPYPCRRVEWRNVETNEVIEADVAGWRHRHTIQEEQRQVNGAPYSRLTDDTRETTAL